MTAAALAPLANIAIPSIDTLTRNAAKLLQESLAQGVQAAVDAGITTTLTAQDIELARSNIKALAFVQAVGLHGVYRYLRDFVSRQAVPILAVEEYLDGWLHSYGLPRKPAGVASGGLTGTGTVGSVITAGSQYQVDGSDVLLTVAADATVDGTGALAVQVVASVAGTAGNLAAGTAVTLLTSVAGINSAAEVDGDGLSGGVEVETDAQAVYRLQQRLANEPRGGSPADYARWALSVTGITRAWGVRNPAGPTSAGVIIMADGNTTDGLPTEAMRLAVRDYIRDPRRGPPDEQFVIIPTLKPLDPTLAIYPDTPETRAAVTASLDDLFFREAVPGGSIPHSHMIEAVSVSLGEYNHTWVSPSVISGHVFTSDPYELLTLGTITFTTTS